ncbi:MAG: hypothetical protein ACR2NP_13190 [Pirellulaceae bacterium]
MIRVLLLAAMAVCWPLESPAADETRQLVIVVGAAGESQYGSQFAEWADLWATAARRSDFGVTLLAGDDGSGSTLESLRDRLTTQADSGEAELWLVLIGHGTFDGTDAKFNLVGPDVTASQFGEWLKMRTGKSVIINCASCSGPFASALTGENRIVVTATKSGYEMNFARFGQFLAETIADPEIDLDKDRQTSLLEAFIIASGRTAEFYASESRLATEHAMIEDNSDGLGTPGEWFRGIRVTRVAKDGSSPDGLRANQVFFVMNELESRLSEAQASQRDELESQLEDLRKTKDRLTEDQYYEQLEVIMLELARLYQSVQDGQPAN